MIINFLKWIFFKECHLSHIFFSIIFRNLFNAISLMIIRVKWHIEYHISVKHFKILEISINI